MKKSILLLMFLLVSTLTLTSCREEKSTGEKIEDGIEEVGDEMEDVGDEIDDATDDN